jgi:phosphatidylglycerol lysyltransferase
MSRYVRFAGPIISFALFVGALVVLSHELHGERVRDVLHQLGSIPHARIALALVPTIATFVVLTGYDWLSLRYVRRQLAYRRIALASFISYAFSQTLGFPLLTGGAMRLRLYTGWGLGAVQVTQVVAFASFTFWIGVLFAGGLVLTVAPADRLAPLIHVPAVAVRPIGVVCVLAVLAYVLWTALGRRVVRIRGWRFRRPTIRIAVGQIVVASLDWVCASTVLYLLLPAHLGVSYPVFFGLFLVAFVAGILSAVPAGAGVFEGMLLLLLPDTVPDAQLLGAFVAYRLIYYLLPLVVAALMLGGYELLRSRTTVLRTARALRVFGRWVPVLAPNVFALTTFMGGVILLVSGATPETVGRMGWVSALLPLPIIEVSHFLGSLAGVGLVLLAFGLQRRLDAAYHAARLLLAGGVVFSLTKGLDYEEAIALSAMLAALWPAKRHFYRQTSLLAEPWTLGWIVAVATVIAGTLWLGFFSYSNVDYRTELWWRFALRGDAPRFLRASVGIVAVTFVFAARRLMRAAPGRPRLPTPEELEKAEAIARGADDTTAYLALLGDKALMFSDSGRSFLMYAESGRTWVALGDPVGPAEEHAELAWRFRELAHRHDARTAFYLVSRQNLGLYVELGLSLLKIGEEAHVDLTAFSLDGKERKKMRNLVNARAKQGASVEVMPREATAGLLPELRAISDAWLAAKNTREKGFSLGRMDDDYMRRLPIAVVRQDDQIVAFANVLEGGERHELSIDLMRYHPSRAPDNVMEFLLIELMLYGKAQGYRWFNLGMAPLSGLEPRTAAPVWNRVGSLAFGLGEHFFNFRGLRLYKEKFDPVWEARFIASSGGIALPRVIADIATLIAGGL